MSTHCRWISHVRCVVTGRLDVEDSFGNDAVLQEVDTMNRSRLEKVRNTIKNLAATRPGLVTSENEVATDDSLLAHYPDRIATIDTFDMCTYHSKIVEGDDCRTLGCIAGVTISLYTSEAREIAKSAFKRLGPADIAQQLLGLTVTESRELFSGRLAEWIDNPVTTARSVQGNRSPASRSRSNQNLGPSARIGCTGSH